jgi:cupin 2 domain-containing protein
MSQTANLFAEIPTTLPNELFTMLLDATKVCIDKVISKGHASAKGSWYDQDQHE